jgi:hypothetical protein
MLGFVALSVAARDLEEACLSGGDRAPASARFAVARLEALRLLRGLETPAPIADPERLSA